MERLWAVCAWQVGQCREMGEGEEEQFEGLGLERLFGVSVARLQMKLEAELTMWLSYWRDCRLGEEGSPVGALEQPYMLRSGRAGVSSEGDVVGKVGVPGRPGGQCVTVPNPGTASSAPGTLRTPRPPELWSWALRCPCQRGGSGRRWCCHSCGLTWDSSRVQPLLSH